MHTRVRPGPTDTGETLVELIIAVAIMGIAVVAIVGGMATFILMSDVHRKQASAGANVRNYAEAVKAIDVAVAAKDAPKDYLTYLKGQALSLQTPCLTRTLMPSRSMAPLSLLTVPSMTRSL